MQTAARVLGALLAAATLLAQQRFGEAEFDRWMRELSNWGRWGKDADLVRSEENRQPSDAR
jgi:hypothetical protein